MSASTTNPLHNWIDRLKANDEIMLQSVYVANYPKVERFVTTNSGTTDDAKDIYQEAFIATWRNIQLDRIQFETPDKLNGYLFRIAQFKWLDHLRANKNKKLVDLTPAFDREEERSSPEEINYLERVKQYYSSMGEPCKTVLYRFYFLKESMNAIANVFSWTDATAKNNKYRCLQRLREMVLNKNGND